MVTYGAKRIVSAQLLFHADYGYICVWNLRKGIEPYILQKNVQLVIPHRCTEKNIKLKKKTYNNYFVSENVSHCWIVTVSKRLH